MLGREESEIWRGVRDVLVPEISTYVCLSANSRIEHCRGMFNQVFMCGRELHIALDSDIQHSTLPFRNSGQCLCRTNCEGGLFGGRGDPGETGSLHKADADIS